VSKPPSKPTQAEQAKASPATAVQGSATPPTKKPAASVASATAPATKNAVGKSDTKKTVPASPAAQGPGLKTPAVTKIPTAPTPAPTTPKATTGKTSGGKGSASRTPPPQVMSPPNPTPISNRFTDRFAPAARPAARLIDEAPELPRPPQKIDPKLVNAWKTKPGRELTEPELLAMPEDVYMNDKQLDFFRVRLQLQRDDLLSNAGETTEHLREDTSIVPDPADRATIEEEHALELRTRDRERKLLKKISQSITRLDSGEYGFCDETGEPIGLPRLLARPTATLSLEAQQRRELKQKMFGD